MLSSLSADFQAHGWLVHMFVVSDDMQRQVARDSWYPSRRWVDRAVDARSLESMPWDLDCGPQCMGFSYLPPRGPMVKYSNGPGWNFGAGLLFSAAPSLWTHVRCASVADGNSVKRVPCGQRTSGVCRSPQRPSETCKDLRASCGVHADRRYSHGGVDGCDEPYFCTSRFWFSPTISDSRAFTRRYQHAGDTWRTMCKFRADERTLFESSQHAFFKAKKESRQQVWESEVNMYVGPSDGGAGGALLMYLQALLHDRTVGSAADLEALRRLRDHLARLGKHVPLVEISMEAPKSLAKWDERRSTPIDLLREPYRMRLVENLDRKSVV